MWTFGLIGTLKDEHIETLYKNYKKYREEGVSPLMSLHMAWTKMREEYNI